ncbi:MAG: VirB8/TrbF family protein [Gammaproteobacteria bacterium]
MKFQNKVKLFILNKIATFSSFVKPLKQATPVSPKERSDNPYLTARRTWNEHVGSVVAARQTWQMLSILSLLIALVGVGGMIHIGSKSKFVPYIVEVDKLGQAIAVSQAERAMPVDQRIIHASVASFVSDARLVSPDVALQRKAVFRVYSMLAPDTPGTVKMNEWLNSSEESTPFRRAAKETVNVEVLSAIPQTEDTWQVDWMETVRDRQGIVKSQSRMRALVTVFLVPATPQTTEEQIRNNPMGIYVRDFSWSKQV